MPTRRNFLTQSALALLATQARALESQAPAFPTATVAQGVLRGETTPFAHVFRAIPYAQPPVGPLRFRPPQPPQPWSGTRDALQFGPASVQPGLASYPQSEDCLTLNLWQPLGPGPFPVFVWVHGGGFTAGRASEPQYDGTAFARNGILCISVQYRLGVLGFVDMSPILGPTYAGSANNALRDLIAALTWLQRNLPAFSGDPRRVTIGGESAGAKLTDILMGIPSAAPLFSQVISESGGAERFWTEPEAQSVARGFATTWTRQTTLAPAQLLTAPARQLIDAQTIFLDTWPAHFPLRPQLDATLMPAPPTAAIAAGSSHGKHLLLGTNREESALFLGAHPTKPVSPRDLGNVPLAAFDRVAAHYQALYPDIPKDLRELRSVTAEEYWIPSLRVAEAHVASGNPAFVYRFDFSELTGRYPGLAFHSEELRFVWSFFREGPQSTPADLSLAAQVHTAWCAFLRGQTPTAPGLPSWPPYTLPTRPTMLLDTASRIAGDPAQAERKLWTAYLNPPAT